MKPLLLLLIVFLTGCCATGTYTKIVDPTWVQKIDAEELSRTIIRYTTKLKREYGLSLEDSKCYYSDCSERIRIVLSSQKCPEICEARELLVDVVEGLLVALNNNPSIRADACDYQFSSDNIEMYISFESYFSEYVDPFYIGWIELRDGLAMYYESTLKQWYYDRWHSRIEPYYKSVQFAAAQREANMIYPPKAGLTTGDTVIIDTISTPSGPRRAPPQVR